MSTTEKNPAAENSFGLILRELREKHSAEKAPPERARNTSGGISNDDLEIDNGHDSTRAANAASLAK